MALGPGSLQNGRAGWLVNRMVCLIHLGRLSVCNAYVPCSDPYGLLLYAIKNCVFNQYYLLVCLQNFHLDSRLVTFLTPLPT